MSTQKQKKKMKLKNEFLKKLRKMLIQMYEMTKFCINIRFKNKNYEIKMNL